MLVVSLFQDCLKSCLPISESEESEYESANEQSFDTTPTVPSESRFQEWRLDVQDTKVLENKVRERDKHLFPMLHFYHKQLLGI